MRVLRYMAVLRRLRMALGLSAILTVLSLDVLISSYGWGGIACGRFAFPLPAKHQQPLTNIFFLKAHKCASTTVQNILMRFGLERGLDFLVPAKGTYIGYPYKFRAKMALQNYTTVDGRYNIFTHHCRYDRAEVEKVMRKNTRFVTILRHPADTYEALFKYYDFPKDFNISYERLLNERGSEKVLNKRRMDRFGFNQMSFDLGMLDNQFNSSQAVGDFIAQIDREFDLVMVVEQMDASLVLLADVMHWPLEHVTYLTLNSRADKDVYVMSDSQRQRITELNPVDHRLYSFFLQRFYKRIVDYGEARMRRDVSRLLLLNKQLRSRCVEASNNDGYAGTLSYKLRDKADELCVRATQNEIDITRELRSLQQKRTEALRKEGLLQN